MVPSNKIVIHPNSVQDSVLPFFDGYAYLVTRVVPTLYHIAVAAARQHCGVVRHCSQAISGKQTSHLLGGRAGPLSVSRPRESGVDELHTSRRHSRR